MKYINLIQNHNINLDRSRIIINGLSRKNYKYKKRLDIPTIPDFQIFKKSIKKPVRNRHSYLNQRKISKL